MVKPYFEGVLTLLWREGRERLCFCFRIKLSQVKKEEARSQYNVKMSVYIGNPSFVINAEDSFLHTLQCEGYKVKKGKATHFNQD